MAVSSVNSLYTNTTTSSNTRNTDEMGKDEFLKLLITQMKYQDPLSPMDNTEYVAQLAQFTSLEQMNNMTSGISSMQALSMTGKIVTATVTDSSTNTETTIQGVVDSVKLKSGKATLMVDGQEVELENVTSVQDYSRPDISNLSSIIGQMCNGYIYNSETLDVLSVQGTVSGIEKGTYEDYAVVNGIESQLDSILSDDYDSSESMLDYLNNKIGEDVSLQITSSETGKKVPVTGNLEAVNQVDGNIIVTLNSVNVPVDGIYSITKEQ